ncbi:MAG: SLBB domain-containing protein [Bacteroidales bacterium]|nr:SLBB domain-containing protein [Bacteroidales bacterium]
MNKKIFVSFVFLFLCLFSALGQSMTDAQVIKFVQTKHSQGLSQQEIASQLLARGVTMEQMQRVKNKAQVLANESNEVKEIEKTITRTQPEVEGIPADKLPSANGPKVFGRDIFNNKNLSFQPSNNMATPSDYVLGAGDQVVIDVWGSTQQKFVETISPDGDITIENIGLIHLGGLLVSQAKARLNQMLGQYFSECSINLSVGDIRTIQVQVVGEVNVPGSYSISSLSNAFNALYAAGGINETGTLRDIKVYRRGRQITVIDVYDYLLNGSAAGDTRLEDNDVIVVGPYDCLVNIQGKVKRPMWYEMKKTETVSQLLEYSGGMTGDAYSANIRLIRKAGEEYSVHTLTDAEMSNFTLSDRDEIHVDQTRSRFSNMVEIRGAVKHEGQFELGDNIRTVRDLLLAADGLSEEAYQERAVLHRKKEDLTLEIVGIDIKNLLEGKVKDIPLRKHDMIFIPKKTEHLIERKVKIIGEVVYPGSYPFADNTTIQDLILQAGGFTDAASLARVDVFRRLRDAMAESDANQSAEYFTFSLDELYALLQDTTFFLMPFDEVYVRKSPAYEPQQNVSVRGEVNFEGVYSMTSKDYRLSDLINAAGGFSQQGYARGARLIRRMTEEEKLHREKSAKKTQVQLYEDGIKDKMFMSQVDTLLSMKMDWEDTYPVAFDLETALKNPGSDKDIVLREGDVLIVPKYSNIIKVSGEVNYPLSMNYEGNNSLRYYIKHAGGYGNKARKKTPTSYTPMAGLRR